MDAENVQEVSRPILVRATICFGGLQAGQVVSVDLRDPEIDGYLSAQFLVPANDHSEPPAAGIGIEGRG